MIGEIDCYGILKSLIDQFWCCLTASSWYQSGSIDIFLAAFTVCLAFIWVVLKLFYFNDFNIILSHFNFIIQEDKSIW